MELLLFVFATDVKFWCFCGAIVTDGVAKVSSFLKGVRNFRSGKNVTKSVQYKFKKKKQKLIVFLYCVYLIISESILFSKKIKESNSTKNSHAKPVRE